MLSHFPGTNLETRQRSVFMISQPLPPKQAYPDALLSVRLLVWTACPLLLSQAGGS